MLNCLAESIVPIKEVQCGVNHQLLRIFAFMLSYLVEMRFLFGGEVKLHRGSVDSLALAVNRYGRAKAGGAIDAGVCQPTVATGSTVMMRW